MSDNLIDFIPHRCLNCKTVETELASLRDRIQNLAAEWEADIERYEQAGRIGAGPTFVTRITNTMGHLSDLRRLLTTNGLTDDD